MKRLPIPQKLVYEKNYVHEKILRTRNCRREFIKNLLPEKRKENMQTKQPRFTSRLNEKLRVFRNTIEKLLTHGVVNSHVKHWCHLQFCLSFYGLTVKSK